MGYGDASCYAGSEFVTPELDRLAAEGLRFTDFPFEWKRLLADAGGADDGALPAAGGNLPNVVYAPPSRREHYWGMQDVEVTFAEVLRDAGYATGLMGKWHLGYTVNYNPVKHGFDEFRGYVSGNVDYISHLDGTEKFDWWKGTELGQGRGLLDAPDYGAFDRVHRGAQGGAVLSLRGARSGALPLAGAGGSGAAGAREELGRRAEGGGAGL